MPRDPKRCTWTTCERPRREGEAYCRLHALMESLNRAEEWFGEAKKELSQLMREDDERRAEEESRQLQAEADGAADDYQWEQDHA